MSRNHEFEWRQQQLMADKDNGTTQRSGSKGRSNTTGNAVAKMKTTRVPCRAAQGKIGLVVTGMPRSGTSALARVLSLFGADLPKNLMPLVPGNNPEGFWEPLDLVNLHDKMLRAAGTRWHDPGLIPALWENQQFIRPYKCAS